MKIAIVHNLPSGGAKRALHDLEKCLRARGHALHLYTFAGADEEYCPLAPYVEQSRTFPEPPAPSVIVGAPLLSGYLLLFRRLRLIYSMRIHYRRMAVAIDRGGYDFVFVHPCRVFKAPLLLPYLRTPSVFFAQERLLLTRLNAGALNAATLILANSSYQAAVLTRIYRVNPAVVHLGVDTDLFHPLPRAMREKTVLSVGMLSPYKGHDFILRAVARMPPASRPSLTVAANAGGDQTRRRLIALAENLKVSLRIATRVDDHELVRLYNGALALCCAQVREPFGLVAIEAMACGTPVIAVREGGLAESVRDGVNGILTERDEEQFSSALKRLQGDRGLWNRCAEGGIESVRRYWNIDAACERFLKTLSDAGIAPGSRSRISSPGIPSADERHGPPVHHRRSINP
ncbi:MAG: glycosyltransferase [Candidatus Aureabacteria bacterium]|nr:glycosyltransferase [Candidatus Auribacterota bacterium]